VVVQVGAVKIYVAAAVEVLRRKVRQGETQETINLSFTLPFNANVFFCRVFLNLPMCMTKLRVLVLSFPHFMGGLHKKIMLFLLFPK
jgi:hypothetical protein